MSYNIQKSTFSTGSTVMWKVGTDVSRPLQTLIKIISTPALTFAERCGRLEEGALAESETD